MSNDDDDNNDNLRRPMLTAEIACFFVYVPYNLTRNKKEKAITHN
jgi:hypothetical protein